MDQLARYRTLIKECITDQVAYITNPKSSFKLEALCAFDEERDEYLLLYVGWNQCKLTDLLTYHVRIKDGKIHIEEDNTEEGIATELIRRGVPEHHIVMGFHPPELRHMTEFAVA